ncbi:hypothetical protein BH11BAC2_BH11BAC2_15830 [soil metagenome]
MRRRGIFITIVSLCYIFGNITCTLLNKNSWPFNSYNFFNFNSRNNNVPRLKILLVSDIGNKSLVDPGNVFPVEFFRAYGLCKNVFVKKDYIQERQRISILMKKYILENSSQRKFDEILKPVFSDKNEYKEVKIVLVEYNLNKNQNDIDFLSIVDTLYTVK